MNRRHCAFARCGAGGIFSGSILDPVPGGRCSARMGQAALLIVLLVISGCVRQAAPAPPVQRNTPPPWDAPRDAVSYIKAAGLEAQPLNSNGKSQVIDLCITFDGTPVKVPAYVGIDRIRALQAAVHTHDSSGQVWLEGRETDAVTLARFFTVWGARFDGRCLGSACGRLVVKVDGQSTPIHARCVLRRVTELTSRQRPRDATVQRFAEELEVR
jgi:hypothetical protein